MSNTTTLSGDTISGWQSISTINCKLPQPFIQDVALILEQMWQKGNFATFLAAIAKLHYHLDTEVNPHNFQLASFAAELLYNLYLKYRELGYLTDQEEMYRRLFYDQEIVTWAETYAKLDTTKAVSVPKYRWLFDQHNGDLNAHHAIFTQILPRCYYDGDPTFHLIPALADTDSLSIYLDNDQHISYPLTPTVWCPNTGTILTAFNFISVTEPTSLWSILGELKSIHLGIYPNNQLILTITDTYQTNEPVFTHDLEVDQGEMVLAFCYTETNWYLRLASDQITTTIIQPIMNMDMDYLQLNVPLQDNRRECSISGLTYYPQTILDPYLASLLA